jgi:hypothetical protein
MGKPRHWAIIALAVSGLALGLSGCQQPPIIPDQLGPEPVEIDQPTPTYRALVERYNANVNKLGSIWASTEVHLRWQGEAGQAQSEHGDGTLIIVRPRKVALTIGKLGNTVLWAGSNADGYWLFDKRDNSKVYFGRYRHIDKPCSRSLPMPIQPDAVPYLLGTMPLDPGNASADDAVERYNGYYLIEPPGLDVRLWLHPKTAQPRRVDLLDDNGEKAVTAVLSDLEPMRLTDVAHEDWPTLAHEARIYLHTEDETQQANVRIQLKNTSDGQFGDRINPKAFNFDTLMQVHDPKRTIDLDADCYDSPPGLGLSPDAEDEH